MYSKSNIHDSDTKTEKVLCQIIYENKSCGFDITIKL